MSCPHVSAIAAIVKSAHPSWSPFDYGSGHVNPAAAVDPGLVYDFDSSDVIDFLCSTGASPAQLRGNISVHRTVTYYGEGPAVYKAKVYSPAGVYATVTPNELSFKKMGEKMSFTVNITPYKTSSKSFVFGALTWTDGMHVVRSPIGLNILSLGSV